MKNIFKNKIVLISAVLILFLSIVLYVILVPGNITQKQNVNQLTSAIPTPTTTFPTYPKSPSDSLDALPTTPTDWITGDNPYYTMKFPPDWKPNITSIAGGGISVSFLPIKNAHFPRFDIEAAPTGPNNSIEQRIERLKQLTPFNYTEGKIEFKGQLTIQISEILPIADMKGNPVHKNYLFFNKGNNTYVLTYAYFQDENAEANKEQLLQILNSVELK